jgi:acetolactate synthase-1/2/3 large subunit
MGPPAQVATLIVPADSSWLEGGRVAPRAAVRKPSPVAAEVIDEVAKILTSSEPAALLAGGSAVRARGLRAASRIANKTGCKLLCETFPTRLERGAGLPPIERLAYLAEFAAMQMDGLKHLILVDAKAPVSFFAYPGKASYLVPDGCTVHVLAADTDDAPAALEALAERIGAKGGETIQPASRPARPTGPLTAETACQAIGALLPEGAIVSDEGNTTSALYGPMMTAGAPPHDWLCLTGGAIGQGLPVATGAAVACRDRKVICLESDGSAMYTIQSLWTQAREGLDVVTVLFNNSSYAVLNMELSRVGVHASGPKAKEMLDLHQPDLDFAQIARGMGVPATRATTAEEFYDQFERAVHGPGPSLIEAIVPSLL